MTKTRPAMKTRARASTMKPAMASALAALLLAG